MSTPLKRFLAQPVEDPSAEFEKVVFGCAMRCAHSPILCISSVLEGNTVKCTIQCPVRERSLTTSIANASRTIDLFMSTIIRTNVVCKPTIKFEDVHMIDQRMARKIVHIFTNKGPEIVSMNLILKRGKGFDDNLGLEYLIDVLTPSSRAKLVQVTGDILGKISLGTRREEGPIPNIELEVYHAELLASHKIAVTANHIDIENLTLIGPLRGESDATKKRIRRAEEFTVDHFASLSLNDAEVIPIVDMPKLRALKLHYPIGIDVKTVEDTERCIAFLKGCANLESLTLRFGVADGPALAHVVDVISRIRSLKYLSIGLTGFPESWTTIAHSLRNNATSLRDLVIECDQPPEEVMVNLAATHAYLEYLQFTGFPMTPAAQLIKQKRERQDWLTVVAMTDIEADVGMELSTYL